jgi:hypothetical protein
LSSRVGALVLRKFCKKTNEPYPSQAPTAWTKHTVGHVLAGCNSTEEVMEEATNAKLVADWMLSITAILLVLVIAGAIYLQSRQNRFALGIDLLLDMDDRFNTPMMRVSRRKASTI